MHWRHITVSGKGKYLHPYCSALRPYCGAAADRWQPHLRPWMLREGSVQEHSQLPLPIACAVRAWVGLSDRVVALGCSCDAAATWQRPHL